MQNRKHMRWIWLVALFTLLGAVSGQAVTITVDAGGSGDYTTIQAAIDASASGDTIEIAAGTYVENPIITKRLHLIGAGDDVAGTIIQGDPSSTTVVRVFVGGTSAVERLILEGIRVTGGKAATPGGNTGAGIELATGVGHVLLRHVTSTGNDGHGFDFNATAAVSDVHLEHCTLVENKGAGVRIPQSLPSLIGFSLTDSTIAGNEGIGVLLYSAGVTDVLISNCSFEGNNSNGATGGDLILSGFTGDAVFEDLSFESMDADSTIRMSGTKNSDKTPNAPAGHVEFRNITIAGTQAGTYPGAAIAISRYTDASDISFENVVLASAGSFGVHLGTINGTMNLGGVTFDGSYTAGDLYLGQHGEQSGTSNTYPLATIQVDASAAVFAATSDPFEIEDLVHHALDDADLGLVTWVPNSVFVTPNSGSIQRGIDAVVGSTVYVAAGTYTEHVTIDKSLALQGAGALQTTIDVSGLPNQNPHVAVEVQNGVNNVVVDGFTLIGVPAFHHSDDSVIRCGGSSGTNNDVTISHNTIDGYMGILFKSGDGLTIQQNGITFNKNAIVIQHGCTNVDISDNTMTGGTSMDTDPAGIYMTSTTGSITGNTVENVIAPDDRGKGITGSSNHDLLIDDNVINNTGYDGISFWSNTHHVTISNNTLSNNAQTYTAGGAITIKGDDLTIINNNITGSGHDGVIIDTHELASVRIDINYNNIWGNADYGVNVQNAGETVDAENNWWGNVNGPSDPSGIKEMPHEPEPAVADMLNEEPVGDLGNGVSDNVDYCPWLQVPYPLTPMAFVIDHAKIDFKKKADDDKVRVQGKLELDVTSDGVDISEDVIVTVGSFSETITMVEKGKKGDKWEYKRPRGGTGAVKHMTIDWKNGRFDIHLDKADLSGATNPLFISIRIGDDVGSESILMSEKKHHWDYKAKHGPKAVEIEPFAIMDELKVVAYPNPIRDVHTATFQVMGTLAAEVEEIRVQIYDLSGRLVWEDAALGSELDWHTDNLSGSYLANGFYVYRVSVRVDGSWIFHDTGKIAVLR